MARRKDGNSRGSASYMSHDSSNLSASFCESRNNSLSPFYSARTMYGGASALLPYGRPSLNKMRSASTSRLNLFTPQSQITIQPVSPSPNRFNDQETMSTAARRILDTLEKYCSPVRDAKRIPVNESRNNTSANKLDSQETPSRGVKRKLPSLNQMTPSTTELLRIKRQERMQDSVSNARQVITNVLDSTIAAEDSDSSDSVDLDYSILKDDTTDRVNSQKYVGKMRRKDNKKFDNEPLPPLKLPNAVLKITNLPKFDITDTFTFSKPLLLENLEQIVTESTETKEVNSTAESEDKSSQTPVMKDISTSSAQEKLIATDNDKPIIELPKPPAKKETTPLTSSASTLAWADKFKPSAITTPVTSTAVTTVPTTSPSITNNKNPLLKPTSNAETTFNDTNSFKSPKITLFKNTSANKENNDEKVVSNSIFNSVSSSNADSPSKKKNVLSPSFGSTTSSPSMFGSSGFTKTDSSLPLTNSNPTAVVSSSVTNMFSSSFSSPAPSKFTNDIHIPTPISTPSFGILPSKIEPVDANENNQGSKLFSNMNSFGVSSSTQQQQLQPLGNSLFAKTDSSSPLTTSNPIPVVSSFSSPAPSKLTNDVQAPTPSFGILSNKALDSVDASENHQSSKLFSNVNSLGVSSSTQQQQQQLQPLSNSLFAKTDSSSPLTNSNPTAVVSSSVTNMFSSSFSSPAPSKLTNDIQTPAPSFGILPNKAVDTVDASENNQASKLFSNVNSLGVSSSTQQQQQPLQPLNNSVFGGFGAKVESSTSNNTAFNTTPMFGFGNSNSPSSSIPPITQQSPSTGFSFNGPKANDTSSTPAINQQPASGGFSFNGPKANDASFDFGFGGQSNNTAFNATPMFGFGNSNSATSSTPAINQQPSNAGFSFNGPKANDTSSTPAINQQPASGGFSFNGPKANDTSLKFVFGGSSNNNAFNTMPMLNFGNSNSATPSAPAVNQQPPSGGFSFNGLKANDTSSKFAFGGLTNPSNNTNNVFGSSNASPFNFSSPATNDQSKATMVPPRFNFTGGNAVMSFSAQPATNNTSRETVQPRRIKKAVRRTAK